MSGIDRRDALRLAAALAAAAAGGVPAVVRAQPSDPAEPGAVDLDAIEAAERVAGLRFTPDERRMLLPTVRRALTGFQSIRALDIPNELPPAFDFRVPPPLGASLDAESAGRTPAEPSSCADAPPSDDESLAFAPVWKLAAWLRARSVSSRLLTELCLARLARHDPALLCVVNLMEESALAAADRADRELDAGRVRGPLHGVPWGAKDLLATREAPTTWGAEPFRDRRTDRDAAVVRRLEEAGAVLVAKLSLGALAMNDVWFGGRTRNPWDPAKGSSGSSAGPAAAVAAGLVPFAIGSETLGSIVSPATVCGATGLRPTFGRTSRSGAMALSWTMDKIGPMARCAEDCALVLAAIHGADDPDDPEADLSAETRPFAWNAAARDVDFARLRFGFVEDAFGSAEGGATHREALDAFRSLGARPVPVRLPEAPLDAIRVVLTVEAAAAFDDLTRDDRDDELAAQSPFSWPNVFRANRFVPAVEYLQAQRARTALCRAMRVFMQDWDLIAFPSPGGDPLVATNLTGHPCVAFPDGFRDGLPTGLSLIAPAFAESLLCAAANAYQNATDWHLRRPPIA